MTKYDIAQAEAHLSELLQEAMLGEDVVIARDNQQMVRLVPLGTTRVPGSAKGKIVAIAPDFDEPLTAFQAYD